MICLSPVFVQENLQSISLTSEFSSPLGLSVQKEILAIAFDTHEYLKKPQSTRNNQEKFPHANHCQIPLILLQNEIDPKF